MYRPILKYSKGIMSHVHTQHTNIGNMIFVFEPKYVIEIIKTIDIRIFPGAHQPSLIDVLASDWPIPLWDHYSTNHKHGYPRIVRYGCDLSCGRDPVNTAVDIKGCY